jgi:hypothetical protein
MLAWLASYPRSGNTCSRHVLERAFNISTIDEELLNADGFWNYSPEEWALTSSGRIGLRCPPQAEPHVLARSNEWFLIKTHAERVDDEAPAICVIRDGRDALLSYAWYALQIVEGRTRDEITTSQFRGMLEGLIRYPRPKYGTWNSHTLSWLNRPHTAIVKFESLIRSPIETIAGALQQLGIPHRTTGSFPPDFQQLQRVFPEFYRAGRVGEWQTEFPRDLLELFWSENRVAMQRAGYAEAADAAA